MFAPLKESCDKPRQHIQKQRHHFTDRYLYSQSCGFSSSHVWLWVLGHKEGWVLNNWCFQTVMLEKTLENPLDSTEIKPVNPKENQLWIFVRRTDAKIVAPILWTADVKSLLIWKVPGARKDWGHEEEGTEYKMVELHHWLHGHEFE